MKKFKDFINTGKKYISVMCDNETQQNLSKWASDQGFDLTDGDEKIKFHSTIYYTTNEMDLKNSTVDLSGSLIAAGFEYLGKDEAKNIPVILLKNEGDIKAIRDKYTALGCEDEWPDYKPHISLSYTKENSIDLSKLELPKFELNYDKLIIKPAKD